MSSFSTEDEQRIVEGSRAFFESLVKKDFANVEDFLSPDCRLQDQFGEGRGVSGSDQCMDKIREVAGKLAGAGLTKMESVCVMRNKRQVRFMLHGKVGFMKIAIGFAIEWSCGIISMLVIVRNAVDGEFLEDNTEAPQLEVSPELPTEAVAQHVVPHDESHISAAVADCAHELTDFSITADATATTGPLGVHKDGAAGQAKSEKWFPGKYIQQHRASSNPAVQKIPNPYWAASRPADYNVVMQSVGVNLQPPYLVPRPPAVSAALTVTVESASQLKSRLVRIVTRPVNSYVSVTVAGRSRNTPVVSKSSYPDYGAASPNGENIFIFELPNSVEFRRNGCIEFTIKDKNFRDEDILAEIVLPIISLKCKTDHTAPTALQLPVEHFSKHITRLGKGFKKRRSESHDSHKGEEIAYLNVSISKVDIMLWWVLEEIQARDEAREKIITEEKARKAMEAERKLAEEKKGEKRSKNNKKKCADPEKLTAVIFKEECDWIDGEYCYGYLFVFTPSSFL